VVGDHGALEGADDACAGAPPDYGDGGDGDFVEDSVNQIGD